MGTVKISGGNSKLGRIPSVSLPSIVTCRNCSCQNKCYARKLERIRKSVREAYQHNLKVLQESPQVYWREVEAAIMMSRFFRFHVSGDIPDEEYFHNMVDISKRNPHCQILCFTKKYEIVNKYVSDSFAKMICGTSIRPPLFNVYDTVFRAVIPENLHIIFSGWVDLEMVNPFSLPEAHVKYRDGSTTAREDAIQCGGNCTECAVTDGGCWTLKNGEQVVFNEH